MPAKKPKVAASVKTTARIARTRKPAAPRAKPKRRERKVLDDRSLFGALPGMGKWALPLLKAMRDE